MEYASLLVQALEEKYAARMLVALLREDRPVNKGELIKMLTKGGGRIIDRTREFVDLGLVTEAQENSPPRRKYVSLTPLGRKVAEHLSEIEDLMRRG